MKKDLLLVKVSKENKVPYEEIIAGLHKPSSDSWNDDKTGFFLRSFKPSPKSLVLDVGCHTGFLTKVFAESHPSVQFVGIDISKAYIDAAKKYSSRKNIEYRCSDVLKDSSLKKGSFDYIFFFEVIEHVDSPREFLQRFAYLLKPGGKLLLSTPAAVSITNILFNLKKKHFKYIESEPVGTGTEKDHLYVWDKLTLYRLLFRSGFYSPQYHLSRKYKLFQGQSLCFIVERKK